MSPSQFRLAIFTASLILGTLYALSRQNTEAYLNVNSKSRNECEAWTSIGAWEQIRPSKDLIWKECAPDRQCARLMVPLDYSNPDDEEAVIALVRKPAVVPQDSQMYRGPILFNPGGPGGSGVDLLLGPNGDLLSTIVGPEFDLVSFDPRGIARSTPRISFFKTDIERSLFDYNSLPLVNNSGEGVYRVLAHAQVVGQLAAQADNGYLRHMNTDHTARDMLRIVEAYGRSKLQYWGFSYGTILGATFAAMFPDKIERMVIDGVVDSEDYYAEQWLTSLIDTDKVLDGFFTGCVDAGPEICHFWAPTADDIRRNLTDIFERIRARPMPIKTDTIYGILDYKKLKQTIFTTLYKPHMFFAPLSKALAELSFGNGTALYTLTPVLKAPECKCDPESTPLTNLQVVDATTAIICNDGDDVVDDIEALEKHWKKLMNVSQWGDVWAGIRVNCLGWPKFPKTRFRGPFEGKTSHPILLIGNTADPVTPLWSARNMSRGFEGSVVLQQNSLGHCSLAAPSPCTQGFVRKYFIDGTLPPAGTICEPIGKPFPVEDAVTAQESQDAQFTFDATLSAHGREFLRAVIELSRSDIVTSPF